MKLTKPIYIDNADDLAAWVERLAHADTIAVDTESDSLHHFREKVCLIQMTALGQDVLIDPLALNNLQSLAAPLSNPKCIKIFHDAGYDLVSIKRDFNLHVEGIFDTMVASRLLGCKDFGLAAILKARFNFIADKRLQRSDWAKRPLSEEQISYARYDTHFLTDLAKQLKNELRDKSRLNWAEEEFSRLPEVVLRAHTRPIGVDPDGFWRIRGVKTLSSIIKGRLRALYEMRDKIAESLDRPKFKVLSDTTMLELAKHPPSSIDNLVRKGLRKAGVARFGADILAALAEATPVSGNPPKGVMRKKRSGRFLDAQVRERYECLRNLRRQLADDLGLDPEVALGNAVLEDLARHPPHILKDVKSRPELKGWRYNILAKPLFNCIQKLNIDQIKSETN
ncbi:MAG: HRDC domain-containing protein [Deltaproteobacteria bacterium]|nr:HRDC domain-containing protein [Deltaproteobacteria bacterium]